MQQIDHQGEADRLELEADTEVNNLALKAVEKDRTTVTVVLLVAAIIFLAICYWSIIGQREIPSEFYTETMGPKEKFELRGLFGDQWGAFTGIISGLSFAFVALSLFAQRTELRMSRRELSMQRVELKYARAQSHRQLFELRTQRQEDDRRAIFQKEPIVLVRKILLTPSEKGAEIDFYLDHFGPAACNLEIEAKFSNSTELELSAPQILSEDTKLSHSLTGSELRTLSTLAENEKQLTVSIAIRYRNLAGGCFLCDQEFSISTFLINTAAKQTDKDPRVFVALTTSFMQGGIIELDVR